MASIRAHIADLQAEIERLVPLAEEEEQREATRRALMEERHSNEWRASLGRMAGEQPVGEPLSPLGHTTGIEQAAQAEADNGLIDQTLAAIDAA